MYKAIIIFFLLVGFLIPSLAFSKIDIKWSYIGKQTGFDTISGYNDPFILANRVVNVVLSLLTIIFLATMLYGGLRWMTAQGDDEKVGRAQTAIKAGVIGLVVALSSYAISYFVFSKLISSNTNGTQSSSGSNGCCIVWGTGRMASYCFPNKTESECDSMNGQFIAVVYPNTIHLLI